MFQPDAAPAIWKSWHVAVACGAKIEQLGKQAIAVDHVAFQAALMAGAPGVPAFN